MYSSNLTINNNNSNEKKKKNCTVNIFQRFKTNNILILDINVAFDIILIDKFKDSKKGFNIQIDEDYCFLKHY